MSTVTPPAPQPPPPAAQPVTANAVAIPPEIADLPSGAKLDALFLQALGKGQVVLETKFGAVTVALGGGTPPARPGQALILQILTSGAQPKFQLWPAAGALAQQIKAGFPGQAAASAGGSGGPGGAGGIAGSVTAQPPSPGAVTVQIGGTLTATLLRPFSVPAALLPASVTPVTANSGLPGGPAAPGLAGAGTAQPGGQNSPSGPSSAPGGAAAAGGAAAQPGTAVLPSGTTIEVRVMSLTPPTAQGVSAPAANSGFPMPAQPTISGNPAALASLTPGTSVHGVIIGRAGIAHSILQTPSGPLALPTDPPLPAGTRVELSIFAPPKPPASSGGIHDWKTSFGEGAWPALEAALETLEEMAPAAARHVINSAMPKADQQLAANLLFFLAALRGGDVRDWLGDGPLRILQRLNPELAARMRDEFGRLGGPARDPETGDWRLQVVPFLNGAEIDRLRVLTRDQSEAAENDRPGGGTRFVIDLELSRLGHLQVDGLVGEKGKRVDLVIRTETPLAAHMREDIRRIFSDAAEITGIQGSVGFQAEPANFVNLPRRRPDRDGPAASGFIV